MFISLFKELKIKYAAIYKLFEKHGFEESTDENLCFYNESLNLKIKIYIFSSMSARIRVNYEFTIILNDIKTNDIIIFLDDDSRYSLDTITNAYHEDGLFQLNTIRDAGTAMKLYSSIDVPQLIELCRTIQ